MLLCCGVVLLYHRVVVWCVVLLRWCFRMFLCWSGAAVGHTFANMFAGSLVSKSARLFTCFGHAFTNMFACSLVLTSGEEIREEKREDIREEIICLLVHLFRTYVCKYVRLFTSSGTCSLVH